MEKDEHIFKRSSIPSFDVLSPNEVLKHSGFHISYLENSLDYGCPTTALVLNNTVFLILNGDHRQAYKDISNIEGCELQQSFDYFIAHIVDAHKMGDLTAIILNDNRSNVANHALEYLGGDNIEKLKQAVVAPQPSIDLQDKADVEPDF